MKRIVAATACWILICQLSSAAAAAESARKELTPAQTALRDRVRRTLAIQRQQTFNTLQNTPSDLLSFCLPFGCDTEIRAGGPTGQALNGITALCWNYSCAGSEPLMMCDGHIAARVGLNYQQQPAQLLAMLAMSHVGADYPLRVEKNVRTVADLVEAEQRNCRAGIDQPLRLIGLAFYAPEATWKNGPGEEWSVERMLGQELDRTGRSPTAADLHRPLALSFTLVRRATNGRPIEGQFLRAKQYLETLDEHAFASQNGDGSWSLAGFIGRTADADHAIALRDTGYTLEWLVLSLPAERMEAPQILRAVEYLDTLLSSQRFGVNVPWLCSRDIDAVAHATHALMIYDRRIFQPADAAKPAESKAK
ncbi:MAG: hypothetical protein ABSG68_15535 [Thermoguttaceae bacterium]